MNFKPYLWHTIPFLMTSDVVYKNGIKKLYYNIGVFVAELLCVLIPGENSNV